MGIGDGVTEAMVEKEKQSVERKKVVEEVAKQDLGFVNVKKKRFEHALWLSGRLGNLL